MKTLYTYLFVLTLTPLLAQEPDWQWIKRGGGNGTYSSPTSQYDDRSSAVVTDRHGNTTVCGVLFQAQNNNINGEPTFNYGNRDGFIAQFDCNGNLRWKHTFSSNSYEYGNDLAIDSNGNVYMTGIIGNDNNIYDTAHFVDTSFKIIGDQAFIAKLDTLGELRWLRIAFAHNQSFANPAFSVGESVDCNESRVSMLFRSTGTFTEYAPGISSKHGYQIANYDLDGKLLGIYQVFDNLTKLELRDISLDHDDNVYMTGSLSDTIQIGSILYEPRARHSEAIILQFSSNGNHTWGDISEGIGSSSTHGIEIESIKDQPRSFYLVGSSPTNVKFGNLLIQKTSPGSSGFLVKYYYGTPDWVQYMNGHTATCGLWAVDIDDKENVYVGGIVPKQGIIAGDTIGAIDLVDQYIAKFDKYGNGKYAKTIPSEQGGYNDLVFGIAAGYNGNVFVTGTFEYKMDITSESVKSNGGNTDFFLAKFGIDECEDTTTVKPPDTTSIVEQYSSRKELRVYPIPTQGNITVELDGQSNGQITVYNIVGAEVFSVSFSREENLQINLPEHLENGVYLLKYVGENEIMSNRIILRR